MRPYTHFSLWTKNIEKKHWQRRGQPRNGDDVEDDDKQRKKLSSLQLSVTWKLNKLQNIINAFEYEDGRRRRRRRRRAPKWNRRRRKRKRKTAKKQIKANPNKRRAKMKEENKNWKKVSKEEKRSKTTQSKEAKKAYLKGRGKSNCWRLLARLA